MSPTVWRKVATASDAGATVRLSTGTTYTKVGPHPGRLPRNRCQRATAHVRRSARAWHHNLTLSPGNQDPAATFTWDGVRS